MNESVKNTIDDRVKEISDIVKSEGNLIYYVAIVDSDSGHVESRANISTADQADLLMDLSKRMYRDLLEKANSDNG